MGSYYTFEYQKIKEKTFAYVKNDSNPMAEPECYRIGEFFIEFLNYDFEDFDEGLTELFSCFGRVESDICNEEENDKINEDLDYWSDKIIFDSKFKYNDNIPYFIREFIDTMIDYEHGAYINSEIDRVRGLQDTYREYVAEMFDSLSVSDNPKSPREKYSDKFDYHPVRWKNKMPKGEFKFRSIDEALELELYLMVYEEKYIFRCQNCGLYTIAGKAGAKYCDRNFKPLWGNLVNETYEEIYQLNDEFQKDFYRVNEEEHAEGLKKLEEKYGEALEKGDITQVEKLEKRLNEARFITMEEEDSKSGFRKWISCREYATTEKFYHGDSTHPIDKIRISECSWINSNRSKLKDAKRLTADEIELKRKKALDLMNKAIGETDKYKEQYDNAKTDEEKQKIEKKYSDLYIEAKNVSLIKTDIDENKIE